MKLRVIFENNDALLVGPDARQWLLHFNVQGIVTQRRESFALEALARFVGADLANQSERAFIARVCEAWQKAESQWQADDILSGNQ